MLRRSTKQGKGIEGEEMPFPTVVQSSGWGAI